MKTPLIAAAALFATAALAGDEPKSDPAAPDPRIGAEVRSICFARNINNWKELKGVDDVVLLERGVNDWYYVTLAGACDARLFRSALTIGIENRPAGGCLTQGDVIVVEDVGRFTRRCFITRIYEWDDKAPAPEEKEGQ